MKKNDWSLISRVLIGGSFVSLLLAILGALGTDLYLASTQWMLVAIVLGILGLYAKMER